MFFPLFFSFHFFFFSGLSSQLKLSYRCSFLSVLSPKFVTGNVEHNQLLATTQHKSLPSTVTHFSRRNNVTYSNNNIDDNNEIKKQPFEHVNKIDNDDKFLKEFQHNRIPITNIQRFILSAGSSIAALLNPQRYYDIIK